LPLTQSITGGIECWWLLINLSKHVKAQTPINDSEIKIRNLVENLDDTPEEKYSATTFMTYEVLKA